MYGQFFRGFKSWASFPVPVTGFLQSLCNLQASFACFELFIVNSYGFFPKTYPKENPWALPLIPRMVPRVNLRFSGHKTRSTTGLKAVTTIYSL
jgi:hypothetical protein